MAPNKYEKEIKSDVNDENSDFGWEFYEGNGENQEDNDEKDYQLLLKNNYNYNSDLYDPYI